KARFKRGNTVVVRGSPFVVESARFQGPNVLLRLAGVADRNTADTFRGADIEVSAADVASLPKGQFYWHQVIGLEVFDATSDTALGTVSEILETGANDVYVVRGARGEILIPAIKDVVKDIDPQNGRMVIEPLPGMLPR